VDAVLAKLVQHCVDQGLGYSYSLDMDELAWHMKDYDSGLGLHMHIPRTDLKDLAPDEIVEDVLTSWEAINLKK
jgi:hypothetical protein